MIIYHPRNDLYHCMFRFISIASMQDLEDFDSVRLRIYDLFYLFPHLVKDIEFPRAKGIA
ncbi:ABC-three component system middle component 5, partial [Vibrio parahaemolyticus]|uniref:ABC-three component system middle component 5 n=1 Tax=Vibrio parahaemolyticus TaxID=670 RepID=UPI00358EAEEC